MLDIEVRYQEPNIKMPLSDIKAQIVALTDSEDERRAINDSDLDARIQNRLSHTLQPRLVDIVYDVHLFDAENAYIMMHDNYDDYEGFSLGEADLLFGTR